MFETCKTSVDTKKELIKIVSATSLDIVKKHIAKQFYNVDDVVEFLYNTIIAGGNGILHGPGGFGKSEITKAFFKFYGITPLVVVGHSGTDVESLLGIPNIKKLTDESIYEIAFENSVFNKPGILIFEEFLDVKPSVASALKDIITEGGYRRGDEFIPSKVGSMFICSNKAPDEVVIDFSTAAFYKERFPYSKYVIWNEYSSKEYLNLFKLVYDNFNEHESAFRLIAELCSISCTSDSIISPRIAFSTMNLFLINKDVSILNMVSAINTSKLDEIQHKLRLEQQYKRLNSKFLSMIDVVSSLNFTTHEDALVFSIKGRMLRELIRTSDIKGDDLLDTASTLIGAIEVKLIEAKEVIHEYGRVASIEKFNPLYEDIQEYLFE